MKTVTFTEFRRHAFSLLTEVEQGQTVIIVRHSKPIAKLIPFSGQVDPLPAWKQPGIKLALAGAELSAAILAERKSKASMTPRNSRASIPNSSDNQRSSEPVASHAASGKPAPDGPQ